jgi:hypothetical protein
MKEEIMDMYIYTQITYIFLNNKDTETLKNSVFVYLDGFRVKRLVLY